MLRSQTLCQTFYLMIIYIIIIKRMTLFYISVTGVELSWFSTVQFSSFTQLGLTLCNHMGCNTSGFPVHHKTHIHWVGYAIQPSHSLSSPSPPAFNLSQHQVLFKWVSSSDQVAKIWSFSFSISPSDEHPGFICFRMDWLDLLAVQGTLKSLLQHHSLKASILRRSAFFIVQLSHPYMTTGKNHSLD